MNSQTQLVKKKTGRPLAIDNALGARICSMIAAGVSVRKIGRMSAFPSASTIRRTVSVDAGFSAQYRRARAAAGDTFADRVIEVADATLAGEKPPDAARVAIDAFKWAASKLNPAEYGDHQRLDVAVTIDSTEHAPDWMKARLGPIVDAEAVEVTETEGQPTLADTPSSLAVDIAAAAAEEVTPKGE